MAESMSHVFLSYASADLERALSLARALERAGARVWLDRSGIPGGVSYGPEIAAAIKTSGALVLCCSAAAFASRNVRQEVTLAWKHERPILPLLLEPAQLPEELEYWLEGSQWIELLDRPDENWLPEVLRALGRFGVARRSVTTPAPDAPTGAAVRLPTPLTALLGRHAEVREITDLLATHRLVTLIGPGGVGKTRLAIEAARAAEPSFPDGLAFVDLSPVRDPAQVLPTITRALGVREAPGTELADAVALAIGEGRRLMVLDNLEQVVESAADVAALLTACPHLAVLATSRVLLAVRGELVVPVDPLPLPRAAADAPELAANPGVALFCARAGEAQPGFAPDATELETIAEICRRLDGLPLAIELAAARVVHLPPTALLRRLERRLPVLAGGARDLPARQRTLRDAIAWSHELLNEEEQSLFRRLAVFEGGCTLAAAESVGTASGKPGQDVLDGVASLAASSLLKRETGPDGEPRYRMLETVREFGLERLEASGESEAVRRAHASWCLALAEQNWEFVFMSPIRASWLNLISAEHDNLRAALTWLEGGDAEAALQLAGHLSPYWFFRGHLVEGRGWLERLLALGRQASGPVRARALFGLGRIAHQRGEYGGASAALAESYALLQAAGDRRTGAMVLLRLGSTMTAQGDYDRAAQVLNEALAMSREMDHDDWTALARSELGHAAYGRGDLAAAAAWAQEALAGHQRLADPWGTALDLELLALIACTQGDPTAAASWFAESLESRRAVDEPGGLADWLAGAATVAAASGQAQPAVRLFAAARALGERTGYVFHLPRRATYERGEASAERGLGQRAVVAVREAGRVLPLEEAIAEAAALVDELAASADSPGR